MKQKQNHNLSKHMQPTDMITHRSINGSLS